MTTATTEGKVSLAAPKRRGRPPGSKNKSTTPTARRVPARVGVKAVSAAPKVKVHAVLLTNEGIEILNADGTAKNWLIDLAGAPLFDRRK